MSLQTFVVGPPEDGIWCETCQFSTITASNIELVDMATVEVVLRYRRTECARCEVVDRIYGV